MLKLKIFSFSYKKSGVPKDNTVNGGGFVFDCRFIYNPGRKEEFKHLTGKDNEVIDFLDKNSEMQEFLNHSEAIVKSAIDNYLQREFTDLMVCFGCTGGQHRSVYAAEKLMLRINDMFGRKMTVELHHNDLPIT
jgi:RNase adaptor protein for sRNA GlmZ degradation